MEKPCLGTAPVGLATRPDYGGEKMAVIVKIVGERAEGSQFKILRKISDKLEMGIEMGRLSVGRLVEQRICL